MATLLQVQGLGHSAGDRRLFDALELSVQDGDHLALVGHNGCGKTTLLDLLSGAVTADSGDVVRRRGLRLARVEQFLPPELGAATLLDAVRGRTPDQERWRAEALLMELGFAEGEFEFATRDLSGGQQNRLMLARALVSEPDLLLLDEPTNHLDLATLVLFEQVLEGFKGAFVLVSHDRAFLDAVTRQTVFLRDGRLYHFELPYTRARLALAEADAAAARSRRAEQARIDSLRQSAERLAQWGRVYDNEKFARRARSMARRVERMEAERTFVSDGSPLNLELELGSARSRQAVIVENLEVAVAGRTLFRVDELVVRPGERVALLGHNGVGKTTFIRRLVEAAQAQAAEQAPDPSIRFSPQTVLGYYDQELAEVGGAASGASIIDFAVRRTRRGEQAVRNALIHAGFAFAEHGKAIDTLSGGERARLLFLVLSLNAPNLLIMDEPTNHIDIEGKEALEAQLLAGSATLLITSHDRHFLGAVADRFLWVKAGTVLEINDPTEFFAAAREPRGPGVEAAPRHPGETGADAPPIADGRPADGQEAILERIVELEALLDADRARKPRHQKPALQAAWQRELEALYRRLD